MKEKLKEKVLEAARQAFDVAAHGCTYDEAATAYSRHREFAPYEITETFEEFCGDLRETRRRQREEGERLQKIEREEGERLRKIEHDESVHQRGLEMAKWEQERKSVRGVKTRKSKGIVWLMKKLVRV